MVHRPISDKDRDILTYVGNSLLNNKGHLDHHNIKHIFGNIQGEMSMGKLSRGGVKCQQGRCSWTIGKIYGTQERVTGSAHSNWPKDSRRIQDSKYFYTVNIIFSYRKVKDVDVDLWQQHATLHVIALIYYISNTLIMVYHETVSSR